MFRRFLSHLKHSTQMEVCKDASAEVANPSQVKLLRVDQKTSALLGTMAFEYTNDSLGRDLDKGVAVDFSLFQGVRLPYPKMFIEVSSSRYFAFLEAFGKKPPYSQDDPRMTRRVGTLIFEKKVGDTDVLFMTFCAETNSGDMLMPEFIACFKPDTGEMTFIPRPTKVFKGVMGEEAYRRDIEDNIASWNSDAVSILQLIVILNSNTRMMRVQEESAARSIMYRGKIRKLPSSRTVTIDIGEKTPRQIAKQFLAALRRSHRRHDVMGHYRHYKSGRVVWIKHHERGNGDKIEQRYLVRACMNSPAMVPWND